MESKKRCYYCNGVLVKNETVQKAYPVYGSQGVRDVVHDFHYYCIPKYQSQLDDVERDKQENSDWDKVYRFFNTEILGNPEEKTLDKYAVLRLRGLRVGKWIPKGYNTKKLKNRHEYPAILNTMKFCKQRILKSITNKEFNSYEHKINYILTIIESQLPLIEQRMAKVAKENSYSDKMAEQDTHPEQDKSLTDKEINDYKPKFKGGSKFG